jgi:uncharacterized protein with HEPN domain
MSRHDPKVALLHIRDYAREAMDLGKGITVDQLQTDRTLMLALTRLLEIIGEAATRVPEEIRNHYPAIPWLNIVGMRNRLIHGYDDVDTEIICDVIHSDLPALCLALKNLPE